LYAVTGVQTCALPIYLENVRASAIMAECSKLARGARVLAAE